MPEIYDKTFWNTFYGDNPAVWSGRPNPHLVSDASQLSPGKALDVGSGEGGDALWLAQQGWRVTAIDVSEVALDRARKAAGDLAPQMSFEEHDLLAWAPPANTFDLVSAQYLHFPTPQMHTIVQGLAAAVRQGGTLLVVGHSLSDHRHFGEDFFYTGDELAALLPAGWTLVATAERPHPHREGLDAVLNARRDLLQEP